MNEAFVVLASVMVVAFFLWLLWFCIASDEKRERSWINSDFETMVIFGEKIGDFLNWMSHKKSSNQGKSMTELFITSFLRKRWRTVLLVMFFLFGWFVWPTPYKQLPMSNGNIPQRENRLTKEVEIWDRYLKKWK